MTNTKGGTMTAYDEGLCNTLQRQRQIDEDGNEVGVCREAVCMAIDRIRTLSADLQEYRNACEQKQEQIDSAKDVIKSLTAELAEARGEVERRTALVCGYMIAYACNCMDQGVDIRKIECPLILDECEKALAGDAGEL